MWFICSPRGGFNLLLPASCHACCSEGRERFPMYIHSANVKPFVMCMNKWWNQSRECLDWNAIYIACNWDEVNICWVFYSFFLHYTLTFPVYTLISITHHLVVKTLHTMFSCCTHLESQVKSWDFTSQVKSQSIDLQHTTIQISKHSGLVSNLRSGLQHKKGLEPLFCLVNNGELRTYQQPEKERGTQQIYEC